MANRHTQGKPQVSHQMPPDATRWAELSPRRPPVPVMRITKPDSSNQAGQPK